MSQCVLGVNGTRKDAFCGYIHSGNGVRTCSPVLMRFLTPDGWSPFGGGGINPWAYCTGDPVNRADPSGHMSLQAGLGLGLGIAGIAGALFTGGASLLAAGSISAALAAASGAAMVVGGAGVVADAAGIASAATADAHPVASAVLGWTALVAGLVSLGLGLAGGAYRLLKSATVKLQAKLVRVNGRVGIPMSGEFRNARFLGANHVSDRVSWNMRFEDDVPLGRRLTVVMGARNINSFYRPVNEVAIDGRWTEQVYTPAILRDNIISPDEHYDVYRLVVPHSASYSAGGANLARELRKLLWTPKPVIGYRETPIWLGPVADDLQYAYGLVTNMILRAGRSWQAETAQQVLDILSARYGNTQNALTFQGASVVYPSSARFDIDPFF